MSNDNDHDYNEIDEDDNGNDDDDDVKLAAIILLPWLLRIQKVTGIQNVIELTGVRYTMVIFYIFSNDLNAP